MKRVIHVWGSTALLVALLFTAGVESRTLRQTSATANSSTSVRNGGTATAASKATSSSTIDSQPAIARAIAQAIAEVEKGEDTKAQADAVAVAIGTAFAEVVVETFAVVSATGQDSRACANAQASGEAVATAIARAVSVSLAEAASGLDEAVATSFANTVNTETVELYAESFADACTRYGKAEAFNKVQASGYVESIATAFTKVLAAVTGGMSTAESESTANGEIGETDVRVDSISDVFTSDNSRANAGGSGTANTGR